MLVTIRVSIIEGVKPCLPVPVAHRSNPRQVTRIRVSLVNRQSYDLYRIVGMKRPDPITKRSNLGARAFDQQRILRILLKFSLPHVEGLHPWHHVHAGSESLVDEGHGQGLGLRRRAVAQQDEHAVVGHLVPNG
jgi:hypothetical protein